MAATIDPPPAPADVSDASADVSAGETRAYSYSLDHDTFRGRFPTRAAARRAAESALAQWPTQTEGIWIGRIVRPEPPTHGLAEDVLEELTHRLRDLDEEDAAANVTEAAKAELDARLAAVVGRWMQEHGVLPEARIEAVSEYPLPLPNHVGESQADPEVSLIGTDG